MARSAEIALAAGAALLLAGCATTQQEAARLQLNSARIRLAEAHTVVSSPGHRVRVLRVALVRGRPGSASAFVVEVVNPASTAIADLPISVGVRGGGGRVRVRASALNRAAGSELSYFDAHLPTISAGRTLTWVDTTRAAVAGSARPYALVGDRSDPAVRAAGRLPAIAARVVRRRGATLDVSLHNATAIPQYQLPVYAVARRGGRPVAAGAVTVPHLGSHATERVALALVGSPASARLELAAIPTILH